MVKLFAPRWPRRVQRSIQIHGGGLHQLHAVSATGAMRAHQDLRGHSEIQKRIISDRLLGRGRTDAGERAHRPAQLFRGFQVGDVLKHARKTSSAGAV